MRFRFSYVLAATALLGAACSRDTSVAAPAMARTPVAAASLAAGLNAPADMAIASERSFSALVEDGWSRPTSTNVTITQASDAPRSAPLVGQFRFPAGMTGGSSPDIVERALGTPAPALYLSFWFRLSSNFAGNGTNQLFYLRMGNTSRLTVALEGNARNRLTPVVSVRNVRNYGGDAVLSPNLAPTTRVERGTWHQFEVVVGANTGGNADGTVEWWYDGAKIGDYDDVAFVSAAQSHKLERHQPVARMGRRRRPCTVNTVPLVRSSHCRDGRLGFVAAQ
jgi:hypothetical protein